MMLATRVSLRHTEIMPRPFLPALLSLALLSCGGGSSGSGSSGGGPIGGGGTPTPTPPAANPVSIRIVGFNDLHGFIEPRGNIGFNTASGVQQAYAGGAAYLASAVAAIRAANGNTLVISAGDLFGASAPLSDRFLEEPTIGAMNRVGLDFAAVGNHEFDRGVRELERLASGGCTKYTSLIPCRVESNFGGANFQFLAANVRQGTGTLFPASALRTLGSGANAVQVGVIGLTLRSTPQATSGSTSGLTFTDEADAINRETRSLRSRGADAVVVAIHQGLTQNAGSPINGCGAIAGPLRTILDQLDTGVDLVLSGHTHQAYICDFGTVDASRQFLVTSTTSAGAMFTDTELTVDAANSRVTAANARNVVLQRQATDRAGNPIATNPAFPVFTADGGVASYIQTYIDAARSANIYADPYDIATGQDRAAEPVAGHAHPAPVSVGTEVLELGE
ncbi:5'-nucleotidase [Alteripontixanthobacter maritimus]|uniref:5'-nucleotidase n=1 Tax=Alteripontixanthobacter maritimus TaxID=2161824 RepID=A0A369Q664_9SPHN|nr:metallophosphoesterase [Alteripontixanthobacter maritimus]RDC59005.1 5'-nucleotidase [Alteripontixanthobacter maritimus]